MSQHSSFKIQKSLDQIKSDITFIKKKNEMKDQLSCPNANRKTLSCLYLTQ